MPFVDLAFRLTGGKVPVDHGYALYSAISRLVTEIHDAKNIGVLPIRGTYSGNGELMLRDSSRLVVRMESEQIGQFLKFAGKTLVGKGSRPLSSCLSTKPLNAIEAGSPPTLCFN